MTERRVNVAGEVESCLATSLALLSEEGVKEVRHYLHHGEPELALERLLLELMAQERAPVGFDFNEWLELARRAGLDKDAVLDANVLEKFIAWSRQRR